MKHRQNGFGAVGLLLVIVIVLGIGGAGYTYVKRSAGAHDSTTKMPSSGGKATTSQAAPSEKAKVKGIDIAADTYYAVTLDASNLATGNQYYGKIQAINNEYVKLSPVYYQNSGGTLVLLGNELHAPDPAMYVHQSSITGINQLDTSDPHYTAIIASQKSTPVGVVKDAYPSATPNRYIDTQRYQAVFFADGNVYFGKLASVTQAPLFKSPAQVFTLQSSGQQVSLIKADSTKVSGYQSSQIVFWENLRSDGQVSKALTEYLKQNH